MKRCSPSLVTREMQIQTMRYNSTSIIIIIKKSTNNKCWRGCREKGPSYIVGGNVNGAVTMENGREVSLKKKKKTAIIRFSNMIPLLGAYLKKIKTLIQKDPCTPVLIAALFTITKMWMQPKCPSTDQQMNG